MTQPTTAQAARSYLRNKNCTLWSEFDISKPDDRRFNEAVAWLTAQVQAVEAERRRLAGPRPLSERVVRFHGEGQQPERFTDEEEAIYSD